MIADNVKKISPELQGVNYYRYARNVSGGFQEWLEALSFQHYLETQQVVTPDFASKKIRSFAADGDKLCITPSDYVLGLFDMTGELMRFAITSMATLGALPTADSTERTSDNSSHQRSVLHDMQEMRARLETLEGDIYQANRKLEVTRASVEKVEKVSTNSSGQSFVR